MSSRDVMAGPRKGADEATPRSKRTRRSDGAQRYEAILDATATLLEDVGYEGISARAVAERAGVPKALVFYYFESIHELIERVLERYYARHHTVLEQAVAGDGTLAERLHRMLDRYVDFIEDQRVYPRLVQQQVSGDGAHLQLVLRHLQRFLIWTTRLLRDVAPTEGPFAARHLYLTLSSAVINYFTYAPAMGRRAWGRDPLGRAALDERRAHLHWLVDALLAGLPHAKTER